MGEVKVESHNMGATFSRLTSLSFHVNWASNSWVMTFSKFDLVNQGSRSWVRSKLKVTTWVQHSVDSHPFHSIWIGHTIPELRLFKNLTLKIKGQGHGWGQSPKSQCGSNILSAHIPFIPCQWGIPFLSHTHQGSVSCLEISYFPNIHAVVCAVWFDIVRAYPL